MLSSSQLNISNGGKGAVCAQIGKLGGFDLIVSIGLGPNGSGWHQAWGRAKSTLKGPQSLQTRNQRSMSPRTMKQQS